jgi:L-ascorbate metabolism protein UlaG (beta-lactamase superfamily)
MGRKLYYLKQNVQVEPLVNQWYAWVQIVPPATAAFNIVGRHMKMMASYVQSPELHAAAVANPKMRGGPFIDLKGERVDEVADLLERTKNRAATQIAFTESVRRLDELLQAKADGYSLQPLYAEVPDALRGYVELFYDRHHRPDFKFFEPLLYRSPLYDVSFQSIALSTITGDRSRPFIFSTPRLDNDDTVCLPVPFAAPGLGALFRTKKDPQPLEVVREQLGVDLPAGKEDLFGSFFTETSPRPYERYTSDRMRIRYFGHACILVEFRGVSVLLDPVLSYTYDSDISRFTYLDLPDEIHFVLITHSHHDHVLMETMLQIRHKVRNVIVPKNCTGVLQDPSLKTLLEHVGFTCVREMAELDTIPFADGEITGIPFIGEHHDLLVDSKLTYHIRCRGKSALAMADSCNVAPELYDHIHSLVGDTDVLFLGMECDGAPVSWVYGPLFTTKPERDKDRSRRGRGSNCTEGMDLVHRFNCKEVYVYAMGEEPWVRYILGVEYTPESNPIVQSNMLIEQCRREGRIAERLFAEKEIG